LQSNKFFKCPNLFGWREGYFRVSTSLCSAASGGTHQAGDGGGQIVEIHRLGDINLKTGELEGGMFVPYMI
jgi:hypothetical protein